MANDKNAAPLDPLDLIGIEAAGLENEAEEAQEKILNPNPEPEVDQGALWAQIPKMLGGLLAIAMPDLKNVYTDPACLAWGASMAQVAAKYDWDAAETMSKWAPEISLVFTTLPLLLPTVAAIKARRTEQEKPVQQNATGSEAVVIDETNPMQETPGNFTVPT